MRSYVILTFWGCRGSVPSPGLQTVVYGGNTSCVSVEYRNYFLIFDAGTGLRNLGQQLVARDDLDTIKGSLFLTHTHWDHIQGLPFFVPAFSKNNRFTIYGEGKQQHSLEELLADQMRRPYYPIQMDDVFRADIDFQEVNTGEVIRISDDIHVIPFRLLHPNAAIGYILQIEKTRVAYVTDHEHEVNNLTANVLERVEKVDILIHDAQYTQEEIENGKKGWGHSAWEDVVNLAIKARVGHLYLYHHDPDATDEQLDQRLVLAQERFTNAHIAWEGLKVPLFKWG